MIVGFGNTVLAYGVTYLFPLFVGKIELVHPTKKFLSVFIYSIIPGCILYALQNYLIGTKRKKIAIMSNLISSIIAVGFTLLSLFTSALYLPSGIAAVAGCYLIYSFSGIIFLVPYLTDEWKQFYNVFIHHMDCVIKLLSKSLKLGLSVSIQSVSEHGLQLVRAIIISYLVVTEIAVFNTISQIYVLLSPVLMGIVQSASIMSAQGSSKNILRNTINAHIIIIIIILFILTVLYFLFSDYISAYYLFGISDFDTANRIIKNIFYLYMIYIFLYSIKNIIIGVLRGKESYIKPLAIDFFVNWCVGIPYIYFLCHKRSINIFTLNIIFIFTLLATLLLLVKFVFYTEKNLTSKKEVV